MGHIDFVICTELTETMSKGAEDMIKELMAAEGAAASIIQKAKDKKNEMREEAVKDADKKIDEYRKTLKAQMENDVSAEEAKEAETNKKRDDAHKAMVSQIDQAFNDNKEATIAFIVNAVKNVDVDSCLTATQKDCLMKEG